MCRSFLLENRWPANTLAGRQAGWKYTRRALHALIHMHACAFMSKHTWAHTYMNAQTHTRHDKITNVLHCCVQDLTMWESDLLVRVCSGCCCNQRSPKAWLSHRKSSASSAATSCLCGRNLEGGNRGSEIQSLWPLTWFHVQPWQRPSHRRLSVGRLSPWV